MTRDSLAFAISGTFFGLLVGWIIGSQQPGRAPEPVAVTSAAEAPAAPAPVLDAGRVADLERRADAEPSNGAVRAELGKLYFDAKQFDRAVTWYEEALALEPGDAAVSTDLAVAYYNTNQVDRSLQQFDRALAADPGFLKALLYQGVVRAFGKQDLAGAADSWNRIVALAPDSEEARQARQGLDGIAAAHSGGPAPASGGSGQEERP